ncbi:unnamed protein product [Lota lota]
MSWNDYITNLMGGPAKEGVMEDAAIVCFTEGQESVWAAHASLRDITPAEVKKLISKDRSNIFTDGVMLGGQKCRVITDALYQEDETMNLMTKDGNTICVAKGRTVLVLVKGCKSIHGRQLIQQTIEMAKYLKSMNF